jgi:hypothetical protein
MARDDEYNAYREAHPKIRYSSAKEAARALQEQNRRNNNSSQYSHTRSRLEVYYDYGDRCYYLGHPGRG